MSTKVKIKGKTLESSSTYSEYLGEAIRDLKLKSYFKIIKNDHYRTVDFEPKALLIYHGASNFPSSKQVEEVDIRTITTGTFFKFCEDYITGYEDPNMLSEDTIVFTYRRQRVGKFFVQSQTLTVCDLTHTERGIHVLRDIITYLKNKNVLTEIKTTKETPKERIKVSLGADPEFEYLSRGEVTTYFPDEIRGDNCCESEIGVDGAGDQIEFRPKPGSTPEILVENIRTLMGRVKKYKLSAVGNVFPLGAHIHFGIGYEWTPNSDLIRLLDDFFGKRVIDLSGEARTDYKTLGAWRRQPHGFEYRVPPSAVFENPKFLKICLKICQNIVERYINGEDFSYTVSGKTKAVYSFEDYKENCGINKIEYNYFEKFITNWTQDYSRNLVAFWVKDAKPEEPEDVITVTFSDRWSVEIKDLVSSAFNPVKGSANIELFGLREDRGSEITSGFTFEPFEKIGNDHHTFQKGGVPTLRYGLSYAFRQGNHFARRTTRQIINAMVQDAKARIKA